MWGKATRKRLLQVAGGPITQWRIIFKEGITNYAKCSWEYDKHWELTLGLGNVEVFGDLNKFHWYADRDQNPTGMDSRGGWEGRKWRQCSLALLGIFTGKRSREMAASAGREYGMKEKFSFMYDGFRGSTYAAWDSPIEGKNNRRCGRKGKWLKWCPAQGEEGVAQTGAHGVRVVTGNAESTVHKQVGWRRWWSLPAKFSSDRFYFLGEAGSKFTNWECERGLTVESVRREDAE